MLFRSANENIIRGQLKQLGFLLQEDSANSGVLPATGLMDSGVTTIQATSGSTSSRTVSLYESGTMFVTRGTAATFTFTLPTTAPKGVYYTFYNAVDLNLVVAAGTSGGLVTHNNAAASSVAFQTTSQKVGASLKVIGDGTSWLEIGRAHV